MKKTFRSPFAALILALTFLFSSSQFPASAVTAKLASSAVEQLLVKGRAPKTGYERAAFSDGWGSVNGCTVRNIILKRDLKSITYRDDCVVGTGILKDPYTGKTINFKYGVGTSSAVQIDHVVALSDAWQKGAQQLKPNERYQLYNDPLNLLAVDGPTNSKKSDKDAASWLPPNRSYRCSYVARQIAVKLKYRLWLVTAEKEAMKRVLATCPAQKIPAV